MKNIFISSEFRPLLNPFIWHDINSLGDYRGVNDIKRDTPVVVSLTCEREYFDELPLTIYSVLTQSMTPDRVILWLDEENESLSKLPYEIAQFIKNGLEIRFVKYMKSYTKTVYPLKEIPNSLVVTASEHIFYKKDWLQKLYTSYIVNPKDINVHSAKLVKLKDGIILSPKKWAKSAEEKASFNYCINGAGGVLYPPNCFRADALRADIFLKYIPECDDIWFWVMAVASNRRIRLVKNHHARLILNNYLTNILNIRNCSNVQIKKLIDLYRFNLYSKLI